MKKTLGITLCVIGAIVVGYFALDSGDNYWVFLIIAGLLGMLAAIIKNWPVKPY